MNKFVSVALAASLAFASGGCATVLNGTSVELPFMSDPEGAVIALSTGQTCTTPCEFNLKRGDDLRVDFELEGFKPEFVYVQSRLAGSTFGNILAGGIVGGVVDGSNGASNKLYPRPVYIRLVPVGSDDEAVLLDKDGEVISTVAAHNEEVGEDVRKGIAKQGLTPLPAEDEGE